MYELSQRKTQKCTFINSIFNLMSMDVLIGRMHYKKLLRKIQNQKEEEERKKERKTMHLMQ